MTEQTSPVLSREEHRQQLEKHKRGEQQFDQRSQGYPRQKIVEHDNAQREQLEAAQEREKKLVDALGILITRLDEVHEDEQYKSVWFSYHNHGGRYTGPTYTQELMIARKALDQHSGEEA